MRFAHVARQHHQRRDFFGAGAEAFHIPNWEEKLEEWNRTGIQPWSDTLPYDDEPRPRFWQLQEARERILDAYSVLRHGIEWTYWE